MAYNATTDFVAIWRLVLGAVSKVEMPGLDFVLSALSRSGLITLSVSAIAPVANQSITAWLQPAAPSYSAEGTLHLWDPVAAAYAAATPALFLKMLDAATGQNGVSWWTAIGGAPLNTVGNNGDFAIRTDEPGGVYGPKTAGAWPATPLPGTVNVLSSTELDNTFGNAPGTLIFRGAAEWDPLLIGAEDSILTVLGGLPVWTALSALLDLVFSTVQGSILYRDAGAWAALAPGVANQILITAGPAANPAWGARTAEFPAGTVMLFQQTNAPLGWVKQTALNDYGLRVTSGVVGSVAGSAFSTVFAQTVVGNTTLDTTQIPAHTHAYQVGQLSALYDAAGFNALSGNVPSNTGSTGGGLSHAHAINLTLSYVDVIIASKS